MLIADLYKKFMPILTAFFCYRVVNVYIVCKVPYVIASNFYLIDYTGLRTRSLYRTLKCLIFNDCHNACEKYAI